MATDSAVELDLFFASSASANIRHSIGAGLVLELQSDSRRFVQLFRNGTFIKQVDLRDKVAKKLFVVETVELGATKTLLATALSISRQSIHNYLEIKKNFGVEGLVHGYSIGDDKRRLTQRTAHRGSLPTGNKAQQVAQIRKAAREETANQSPTRELSLNFSFSPDPSVPSVPADQLPFAEAHEWEPSRYAGVMVYFVSLVSQWRWEELLLRHFGTNWMIFHAFLLMAARNIRSVEQLKHVRSREAGVVLGLGKLPWRQRLFEWFYVAARAGKASALTTDFFRYQLQVGLVSLNLWFTDGHLLPYTGQRKVHYAYNTQRQLAVPGQTNQVTCDEQGRIVDFLIEEGKGNLKQRVLTITDKWARDLPLVPVSVFDREGYGAPNFSKLVKANKPFVTWDKNVDTAKLKGLDDTQFSTHFAFNNKKYSVFESQKEYTYAPKPGALSEGGQNDKHVFSLRHFTIWNRSSDRRTCVVAYDAGQELSQEECVCAILGRWGASENAFKHIQVRHPFHYHPGFKLVESERQEIANPVIKAKTREIAGLQGKLKKVYKELVHTKQAQNIDGAVRRNNAREKLAKQREELEASLALAQDAKRQLPQRVDVSTLENYRSFERNDNEGKNLFDFVTASVWNARKQMVEWLKSTYEVETDVVDLLYAIADCQGWVRSSHDEVTVRLEPLQQPRRRAAQEQLCRRLTGLRAQTPNGKSLVIEVGCAPKT